MSESEVEKNRAPLSDPTSEGAFKELEHAVHLARQDKIEFCAVERICETLARMFATKEHEIGLLRVEGGLLRFLFPVALRGAGSIPLSSSAIAARTATSGRAERFNSFTNVRHLRVFEVARLDGADTQKEVRLIQKLMSAPICDDAGEVTGVLQICRKGSDPKSSGPDFTNVDLAKLEAAAAVVGRFLKKKP